MSNAVLLESDGVEAPATEVTAQNWRQYSACRGLDPDLFFPERGDNTAIRKAKEVCAKCLAQPHCLEYALQEGEDQGIWGGCTKETLKLLRKQRGLRVA